MDVPILARRCAAVPHTLGSAGVQFDDEPLDEVAEMAHRLATDRALREGVLAGQRRRLAAFAPAAVEDGAAPVRGAVSAGPRPAVAFVIQRYGAEITGGSESLARAVAERLLDDYRVTVFTSCAVDYVTWRNELPEGTQRRERGRGPALPVRVASATSTPSTPSPSRCTAGRAPMTTRSSGCGARGPRCRRSWRRSPRRRTASTPSCSSPTSTTRPTGALKAAPARAASWCPTTHDEPPLRFSIYDEMFARPRAFAFLTGAGGGAGARRASRSAAARRRSRGSGSTCRGRAGRAGFRRAACRSRGPYALYAGRIDAGKGCAEMIAHYAAYRAGGRPRGPRAHRRAGHGAAGRARAPVPGLPVRRGQAGGDGRARTSWCARAPTRASPSCCWRRSRPACPGW